MPATTRKLGRARRMSQRATEDAIDLTAATPQKPAANDDSIWDVPSSMPATADPRPTPPATRTSARKRAATKQTPKADTSSSSMAPTQDPYDFPDATPAPAPKTRKIVVKKKKQTSPVHQDAPESSPVALVPTGSEAATQLYLAQSELTSSQRNEYMTVSLTSELDNHAAVADSLPEGTAAVVTGTGTTVAVSTPSSSRIRALSRNVASSLLSSAPNSDGGPAPRDTQRWEGSDPQLQGAPQSSPDILTEMDAARRGSSAKRTRTKMVVAGSDEPVASMESSGSARRAKRRKIVTDEDDDEGMMEQQQQGYDGGMQDQGYVEPENNIVEDEAFIPEPEPEPIPEPIDLDPVEAAPSPPPAEPPKKKRGRKKKEPVAKAEEAIVIDDEALLAKPVEEESLEQQAPPAKKRRGRPKKSDVAAKVQPAPLEEPSPGPEEQAVEPEPEVLTELSPNTTQSRAKKQTKSKRKQIKDREDEDEEEGFNPEEEEADEDFNEAEKPKKGTKKGAKTQQLKAVKAEATPAPIIMEAKGEKVVEKVEKAVEKTAKPATTPGKVGYRVGLSKRTRIAPLLKIVRKP
ncbi:hypothetical protein QBC35DRAFT_490725 [Podospora australis]|uniref:AT hook domain-containing protein n=1 Tax=Podospora australis TaxID=1536484 RepID=A0AAN7AKA3_9PEZI|nr:hypothetical protein QBC35DRAFT_490725 [Podospora australis]